jgi:hypothetical protein
MTPKPAPRIIRWILRKTGFAGVCLAPWGIYILAERINDERLIKHEMAHWLQYKRMGAVRFYAAYLWGLLRHGYQDHPMEIEARKAEG